MNIFDGLENRIAQAEEAELSCFKDAEKAEARYWDAYKTGSDVEHASILEKWAVAKASRAIDRTKELENLKKLAPVRNVEIAGFKEELHRIVESAAGVEASSEVACQLDEWAKKVNPAFSFVGWGDTHKGTQGFFPMFSVKVPKGKPDVSLLHAINIMARVIRRDIDYVVDFETVQEGVKQKRYPPILSVTGEAMHLGTVNYRVFRHKRPAPFRSLYSALHAVCR